MKYTIYLSDEQKKLLEYEIVSTELKVHLVRLLERNERFRKHSLINMNLLINRSRSLAGKPVYVLESDDWGGYEDAEYAWHNGEFEVIFRRLNTVQFVEFLCELVEQDWLDASEVSELLRSEGASFSISAEHGNVEPVVLSIEELQEEIHEDEHPNVRILIDRMETALEAKDYAAVLHASASVFETIAKQVVGITAVQDQTLKSFFERYAKDSNLPKELQDRVIATYEARNKTPLAGHGSLKTPNITRQDAITLSELTKAIVRIEYRLAMPDVADHKH